jgi:hypothetical protein
MAEPNADALQNDGSSDDAERKDCVVVDTNELLSSLLLNTAMGAALLFVIQQQKAKLGWPEVIEHEIRKQAMRTADEAIASVGEGLRVLEMLIGSRPDPRLPSREEVESAVSRRITQLSPLLKRVPFTLEHAKAALQRVNDEIPPNAYKNQQFKDSAIWEAVLELATTHRVHFVTKDAAFYKGRDIKAGLAKDLSSECARAGLQVDIYSELAACVEALRPAAPPFDVTAVTAALDSHLKTQLSPEVAKRDFDICEIIKSSVSAFVTERLRVLAIKFDITYAGTDASAEMPPRAEVSIRASGNAQFEMSSGIVSGVQLDEVETRYVDAEGEHKHRSLYLRAMGMVGERTVHHRIEYPIF